MAVRPATSLLLLLFSHHQPLSEARKMTADILLEMIECRLDEGLSSLEGDRSRLARKQIAAEMAFGSVPEMVREGMKEKRLHPAISVRLARTAIHRLLKG